jgi:hypothetical protein
MLDVKFLESLPFACILDMCENNAQGTIVSIAHSIMKAAVACCASRDRHQKAERTMGPALLHVILNGKGYEAVER